MIKNNRSLLGAKNNEATFKNSLSLKFTLPNTESAAISINKTIAAHWWVHLLFQKVLIFGHFSQM